MECWPQYLPSPDSTQYYPVPLSNNQWYPVPHGTCTPSTPTTSDSLSVPLRRIPHRTSPCAPHSPTAQAHTTSRCCSCRAQAVQHARRSGCGRSVLARQRLYTADWAHWAACKECPTSRLTDPLLFCPQAWPSGASSAAQHLPSSFFPSYLPACCHLASKWSPTHPSLAPHFNPISSSGRQLRCTVLQYCGLQPQCCHHDQATGAC